MNSFTYIVREGAVADMNQGSYFRYRETLCRNVTTNAKARRKTKTGAMNRTEESAVDEFAGVAADAEVDSLDEVFGAGRNDLTAVVDVHHVVFQADADEEGRGQVTQ